MSVVFAIIAAASAPARPPAPRPGRQGDRGLPNGPVRPREVALLARTWNALEPFIQALEALGIPTLPGGGGSLLDTPEARDGLALLAFLADPKDDLALLTLLRSPYFAVPDALLHRVAEIRGDRSWWEALRSNEALSRPREVLESLLQDRHRLLPSFLLQEADLATGYTAVLAHLPGAERRLADYGAFLDLVRALEARGEGLAGAVSRLKTLVLRGLEVPRPPLGGLEAFLAVSDTLNGLMAIPNLISVLGSVPLLLRLQREYLSGK